MAVTESEIPCEVGLIEQGCGQMIFISHPAVFNLKCKELNIQYLYTPPPPIFDGTRPFGWLYICYTFLPSFLPTFSIILNNLSYQHTIIGGRGRVESRILSQPQLNYNVTSTVVGGWTRK